MGKRVNGVDFEVQEIQTTDVTAILRGEEPALVPIPVPLQVAGAVSGLAGFTGCPARIVAFQRETATGRSLLTIVIDPRNSAKKSEFAKAIVDGPVMLARQDSNGIFAPLKGSTAFFNACYRCDKISHTLSRIARHVDQIHFVPENGQAKNSERNHQRISRRHKQKRR